VARLDLFHTMVATMLSDEQMDIMMDDTLLPEETIAKLARITRNATLDEVAQKVKDLRCEDRAWLSDYEQGVQQGNSDMLDEIDNELRQMKEEE